MSVLAGLSALVGVVVGFTLTDYLRRRRFAALMDSLRSEIANTAPPTTAELRPRPRPAPRRNPSG